MKLSKIERCSTGTIFLLVVARIFNIDDLSKGNLKAKSELEAMQNMQMVKKICSEQGHAVKFDVEKVVKGKVPEIVELSRQLKKIWD